jgi:hypothetical protein
MNIRTVSRFALSLLVACLVDAGVAQAQTPLPVTVNDEARFLAGLPVSPGSPMEALEASKVGREHAAAVGKTWAELESVRLKAMGEWSEAELKPRINATLPLIYLFGGPDFVSADVLYPSAPAYVLGGLEPIGFVPPLAAMKPDALEAGLTNLRESLTPILRLSHFITDEMATEFRRTELKGILPLLYFFVARSGNDLIGTEAVYIDGEGKLVKNGSGAVPADGVPGVQIAFRSPHGAQTKHLYYFRMDLANAKVTSKPGFFTYLKNLGPANCYLKAASFILHNPGFSITRDFLLGNSKTILQDDSGIPFKAFRRDRWNFVFFGTYVAPEPIFKGSFQPDLDKAFQEATPTRPLPFSTGYAHTRKPSLLLAIEK